MTRLFLPLAVVALLAGLAGCGVKNNNPKPAPGTKPDPRLQPAVRGGGSATPPAGAPQGSGAKVQGPLKVD